MKNWEKALHSWANKKADEAAGCRKQCTTQLEKEYWRAKEIAFAQVMAWASGKRD